MDILHQVVAVSSDILVLCSYTPSYPKFLYNDIISIIYITLYITLM